MTLTISESKNIQSPPGNSLAIFLDANGVLQLKDVRGTTIPLSEFIPSSSDFFFIVDYATATVLMTESSLIPGATYTITNADQNLYGGTEITLTAISVNQLSLQGSGKFYTPKYDLSVESNGYGIWNVYMYGDITNIIGNIYKNEEITAQNGAEAIFISENILQWVSGDWSSAVSIFGSSGTADVSGFVSPEYTEGQIVHWGGKSWQNLKGNVGNFIDKYNLDPLEWKELSFDAENYNIFIDEIQYDFAHDMIIYRKDKFNNIVSGNYQVFTEYQSSEGYNFGNPIKDFQWGCGTENFNVSEYLIVGINANQVINSYCETLNFIGSYFNMNQLINYSEMFANIFSNQTIVFNNILENQSIIDSNIISGTSSIRENKLFNISQINGNIFNNGTIEKNTIGENSNIINNTINGSSINYNEINCNSSIDSNQMSLTASITCNSIKLASSISNNIMNSGNIGYNSFTSQSSIDTNQIATDGFIFKNTLSEQSRIQNSNITLNGSIQCNKISCFSNIVMNISDGFELSYNQLTISRLSFIGLSDSIISVLFQNLNDTTKDISGATHIYRSGYSRNVFQREDGSVRLSYVDNTDVLKIGVVTD